MAAPSVKRWLLESVVVATAYVGTAYLIELAQHGGGKPNLVWLPAGIALAAILIRGALQLPALLLATLVFQLHAFQNTAATPLQAYALTLVTALGSTLQAWLTAWLLRRRFSTLQINTVADALRFSGLTALGCTIAASIGTFALLSQAKVLHQDTLLTWLTWWAGDLGGMLIVAPIVLVSRSWRRKQRDWGLLSLPIISIGASFTLAVAFVVKHIDHDARINEFHDTARILSRTLQSNLDLSLRDLMATHALFYNVTLSQAEFRNFTDGILKRNALIRSISWAPRVGQQELPHFEASAKKEVKPDYQVYDMGNDMQPTPAAVASEYLPILFCEPVAVSQEVHGMNLLSNPARRDAVLLARAMTRPQASRLMQLRRGGEAVAAYWPVYRNEFQHNSSNHDSDSLRGFVVMTFEIARLARESLQGMSLHPTESWLIDITEPSKPQLLYHISGSGDDDKTMPEVEALRQGLNHESTHDFAGRTWLLISRPADLDANLKANGPFLGILLGGTCLTLIMSLYLIGRQRSEAALRQRDERLMSQNAVLSQLARTGLPYEADPLQQLRELIATSALTLRIERVGLWLLENNDSCLVCKALYTRSTGAFIEGATLQASEYPRYFATLQEGRVFATADAQQDPHTSEFTEAYLKPLGITSMMDIPIRVGSRLVGVVCHEHVGEARPWAADEQNFAASIGDLASLVLESQKRSQAEHALQEAYQVLEQKVADRTEELHLANERLRQLDQLKSMFIASMSHELRTPLNAIIGFTGVILQGISGPLNEKQTDHLTRVYGSAKHLLALITDVIDISKIEAGYADVFVQDIAVAKLIDEALANVQQQRLDKGLGLQLDAPANIVVSSDRQRLYQCILNLISNAVKYTEHGQIRIRLQQEAGRVVIEVEDTGIGIAADAMEKLFQPFERIDTHLRIKTPGTGLGLYLTRKIATELLQGGIDVTSTSHQGSTFTLWIPQHLPQTENGNEEALS